MEAYRKFVKCFVEAVRKGDAALFSPFTLAVIMEKLRVLQRRGVPKRNRR